MAVCKWLESVGSEEPVGEKGQFRVGEASEIGNVKQLRNTNCERSGQKVYNAAIIQSQTIVFFAHKQRQDCCAATQGRAVYLR